MKKVLLLQNRIATYRREVYEEISRRLDLTVGYTDRDELKGAGDFRRIFLPSFTVKSLRFQRGGFFKLCRDYDAVIFVGDMHNVSFCMLPFIPMRTKVIAWTIGIRASYTRPYDVTRRHDFVDGIYGRLLSACDAVVFYMKAPLEFWGARLDDRKVFVAHNTVYTIPNNPDFDMKRHLLFIGTLYKGKGLEDLLEVYSRIHADGGTLPVLDIVGGGPESDALKTQVAASGLSDYVVFHGPIYDEREIAAKFARAVLCVSPQQAGLSVLKSMGYGVPFVTAKNAITGGESLNITNGVNGLLYEGSAELEKIVRTAGSDPESFREMGLAAKNWYDTNATVEKMANGVVDAVSFALEESVKRN